MSKPVAIDLCHGLGGWTKGFLAEGFDVIGFDVEEFPTYPGQSIKQDVRTLSGYDLRAVNPAVILASPPCQAYSYMAMPWDRAKREIRWQEWLRTSPFSTGFVLNDVFNACLRIAREAGCPIVIENVKGAQKWVGSAAWHYGSFYLWGDVPALMPFTRGGVKCGGPRDNDWFTKHNLPEFQESMQAQATKNNGGSWFAVVAHNTTSGHSQNPVNNADGLKVPGIKLSEVGFNIAAAQRYRAERDGTKFSGDWFAGYAEQKAAGTISPGRLHGSRSDSRKAASQAIAEIPFDLASWIARCFKPVDSRLPVGRAQHASLASEALQDLQEVAV